MQVFYAHEHPKQKPVLSIFLAGPSPRKKRDCDWRPQAVQHLSNAVFTGAVYVLLPRDGIWPTDYDAQID